MLTVKLFLKPFWVHISLGSLFFVAWANGGYYPILRFIDVEANLAFESFIYLLPLILTINGFRFSKWWMKIVNLIILLTPLLFCLLFLSTNISWLIRGQDPRSKVIEKLDSDNYQVKEIRIRGAAISLPTVIFRQEKPVGLGMVLVKDIYKEALRESNPKIVGLTGNRLGFFGVYGKKQVIELKPNVYW